MNTSRFSIHYQDPGQKVQLPLQPETESIIRIIEKNVRTIKTFFQLPSKNRKRSPERSMIILAWRRTSNTLSEYTSSSSVPPSTIGPNFAHRRVFCKSKSRFQNRSVVPERSAHAVNPGPMVAEITSFWASPTSGPIGLAGRGPRVTSDTLGGTISSRTGALYVARPAFPKLLRHIEYS